jgi:hypothetical protein
VAGILIEFFYDYPNEPEPARLVHATDVIHRVRGGQRTDRPHGVRTNVRICRGLGLRNAIEWWGRVITFDALIGNTDRHPENWGFLVRRIPGSPPAHTLAFAPAFDNGTSLGYEQAEGKLVDACEPAWLTQYIERGTHHCGWDLSDDSPAPHIGLCARYCAAFPQAAAAMRGVLQIDGLRIAEILHPCTAAIDVGIPFSPHSSVKRCSEWEHPARHTLDVPNGNVCKVLAGR